MNKKFLYKLWQIDSTGYDTYDSMIVCAHSQSEAIRIHPSNNPIDDEGRFYNVLLGRKYTASDTWASNCHNVSCELIGEALKSVPLGVVLKSFNAG